MALRILLLIEGAALVLLGLGLALLTLARGGGVTELDAALFEVGAALAAGAVLLAAAPRAQASVHWRSPVLLLNLLALPVTVSLAQSGRLWLAIPIGLMAVSAVVLLARGQSLS